VRGDASTATNITSSENAGSRSGGAHLGVSGSLDAALIEHISGNKHGQISGTDGVSNSAHGYVGVTAPQVSTTGWIQMAAPATMSTGLIVLIVTSRVPSLNIVIEIGEYLFVGICAVLGLGIVFLSARYVCAMLFGGCCSDRETVRKSVHEALKKDLMVEQERAETGRKRQEYMVNFVRSEFGVNPEQLLPLEEVTARLRIIMPRVEAGEATEDEKAEMNRLVSLLDANPEAKQREEEARAAFCAEQAPANAAAARSLRSFFPPEARLLPSITALEMSGVDTSLAKRFLRTSALVLVLTPPEEIASMHWVDLSKCSSLGLSLFELRAVVASLPVKFASDTAKGEKREWAKRLVEALRIMIAKEVKGELQQKDLCYPCFNTIDGFTDSGSLIRGPFDPNLPLTRRPTAVRSEPMSGAAEAQAAAALSATGKSIAERSAAIAAFGKHEDPPIIDRAAVVDSAGARRLRERRVMDAAASTTSSSNNFLVDIASTAAKRQGTLRDGAATEQN